MSEQGIYGILGDVVYRAGDSPGRLRVDESTRYSTIKRIGLKPLVQSSGSDLKKLEMSFSFSAGWGDPDASIKGLQRILKAEKPVYLGSGLGTFDGYYVLKSLSTRIVDTLPTGEILNCEVDVSLLEYPSVEAAESDTPAQDNFSQVR